MLEANFHWGRYLARAAVDLIEMKTGPFFLERKTGFKPAGWGDFKNGSGEKCKAKIEQLSGWAKGMPRIRKMLDFGVVWCGHNPGNKAEWGYTISDAEIQLRWKDCSGVGRSEIAEPPSPEVVQDRTQSRWWGAFKG